MPEVLLTPDEVAKILAISKRTLQDWRHDRRGPAYVTVEGQVRYRRTAVEAYIVQNTVAR